MDLVVKSLQGSYVITGITKETTIYELKRLIHQQYQQAPEPEEQCLVYRHSVLTAADAAIQHLGITHGDLLVLLPVRPTIKRPCAQTTPAADTAAIRAAITEEARSRGMEHTLKEERPPVARRGLRVPAELLGAANEQVLQMLQQAFDEHAPGLQLSINEQDPHAAMEEAEQDDEEELHIPEPPAERIAQVTEMGFSEALARNALLLHRSNVEAALEWLLDHADDASAAEPLSQEQLRRVYGRRRRRVAVRTSLAGLQPEALMSQLTEMVLNVGAAQSALSQNRSMEQAVDAAQPEATQADGPANASSGTSSGQLVHNQPVPSASGAQENAAGALRSPGSRAADAVYTVDFDRLPRDSMSDYDEIDGVGDGDEDEDGDEYFDGDEDPVYDLPIGGTMQLSNLGSADIEQLLQGANLQELALGNQLRMPAGMDTAMAGPQATLLRLLESPALLEQVTANMQGAEPQLQQQEQPAQQPDQQAQHSGRSA